MVKKVGPRLRELAPRSQDAGSRNLVPAPAFFTIPVRRSILFCRPRRMAE